MVRFSRVRIALVQKCVQLAKESNGQTNAETRQGQLRHTTTSVPFGRGSPVISLCPQPDTAENFQNPSAQRAVF
jgi:hypothetical protein